MAITFIRDVITSGYNLSKINSNFEKIEAALLDAVSRSGSTPNQMNSDLDMNGNDLLNVGTLQIDDITIDGTDATGILQRAEDAVDVATGKAVEAALSASEALGYAGTAQGYANDANNSYLATAALLANGDRGDITISGGGSTWTLDNGTVGTAKIVDDAVTTIKILNGAVTEAKLDATFKNSIPVAVSTRTALAALNTANVTRAVLTEYGRAGVFVFVPNNLSSQVTIDTAQGLYVAPASAPTGASGAWVRQSNGMLYDIRWWGAIEDGTTDCTSLINMALQLTNEVFIPPSSSGFRVNGVINIPSNGSILGIGSRSKIIHGGSSNLFSINGSDVCIEGIYVDATNNTAGWTFYINSTASRERITIKNIYATNSKGGLTDANSTGIIITLKLYDVSFRSHKGPGVLLRDAFAFIEMTNCYVDYLGGNTVAQNYIGFAFDNVEGITLNNCEVTGSYNVISGVTSGQMGFWFNVCRAVYLYRVFADNCGGIGIDFIGCSYIRMDNCTASLCNGQGVWIENTTLMQVTNLYVGGRSGAGGATASVTGVVVTGTSQVVFTNVTMVNCTGFGLATLGANTKTSSTGLRFANNGGQYSLASANDQIYASQNSSGGAINGIVGPA